MPYGYYQIVRFAASSTFIILALTLPESKYASVQKILLISLALLFQPIIKIALGRTLWNVVDVIVGITLIISIVLLFRDKKNCIQ